MKSNNHLSFSVALKKGAFVHNAVLTSLSGLCPILLLTTSLKSSLILVALFSILLGLNEVLASLLSSLEKYIRVSLYAIINACLLILISIFFKKAVTDNYAIFVPVLAMSSMIQLRCEKFAVKTNVLNSLIDAASGAIGYGVVALLVGGIRALLLKSNLLLTHIGTKETLLLTFIPLFSLGILAAILKLIVIKFMPNEYIDTFNMSNVFLKPDLVEKDFEKNKNAKEESK